MIRTVRRISVLVLALLLCVSMVGCNADGKQSLVYLDYTNGMDAFGRYNTALYGKNGESDSDGADPGVIYVSEEEDPQWGGYYYRYCTDASSAVPDTEYCRKNAVQILTAHCQRSKDLYHWENAGALGNGYACGIDSQDWCDSNFWAPEVIRNPGDGKYYMYFSASAKRAVGIDCISDSENYQDRLYIGVAVSDTPVGPFDLINDIDEETGRHVPTINFQTGFGLDHNIGAIDAHAFFDDDGALYLYFVRHPDDNYFTGNAIAGMKMKSMAYPDYSTAVILAAPGAKNVTSTPGDSLQYEKGETYFTEESNVNEAPYMYKLNGVYYLTYASNGYTSINYAIHQAVSDSPLGPFTKLDQEEGNPVQDGGLFGDVHGAAHHSIVACGDELYLLYHRHSSIYDGVGWTRAIAVDRLNFVQNANGDVVMTSNGPSRTLTWLPESVSGYENLAQTALVSVNNGTGTQYLTDGVLPLYTVTENQKLSSNGGDVVITLSWQQPVRVSSVMVYNAASSGKAFSKVSDIRFKLAERLPWESQDYDYAVIKDVAIQYDGWDADSEDYLECAPAVAEFESILVTEIQITIAESDRLMEYNKNGDVNTALDVAEIVVLGGAVANE